MVDHIGTITELLDFYSRMAKIYNKPNLPCLRPRLTETETETSPETTETETTETETDRDRDRPRPRQTETETDRDREARSRYIPSRNWLTYKLNMTSFLLLLFSFNTRHAPNPNFSSEFGPNSSDLALRVRLRKLSDEFRPC
jgi:hypothetical protein